MRAYTHKYPSDITREQFEIIRTDLEGAKRKTKPRKIDLYDIFCAILYLIKSGCQWSMIPSDYPNHNTVRNYYDIWSRTSADGTTLMSRVLKKISNNAQKR